MIFSTQSFCPPTYVPEPYSLAGVEFSVLPEEIKQYLATEVGVTKDNIESPRPNLLRTWRRLEDQLKNAIILSNCAFIEVKIAAERTRREAWWRRPEDIRDMNRRRAWHVLNELLPARERVLDNFVKKTNALVWLELQPTNFGRQVSAKEQGVYRDRKIARTIAKTAKPVDVVKEVIKGQEINTKLDILRRIQTPCSPKKIEHQAETKAKPLEISHYNDEEMESNEERQQLEEIKVQLRRADRAPMRTSSVRKETFTRLIELAHSPYSSLKSVAATNIKSFVKDFPELEDEALNAVYDLCEDPVPKVRIEGYQAIIQVSKEQKKWVKRNADVLVQLLQSDEPDEVLVVKKALTEHLDMDPVVTLTVLCDQIVPMDDPMDEEEQSIRDRLRALVLAFISGEAKRGIVERHANVQGSPAEDVLVTSLLKGLTKSTADIDIIVGDILLALPSFSRFSPRGKELLDVLLAEAKASLKVDLPHDDSRSSISQTRAFLDLARLVAVDKQVAHPSQLLRFFLANFVSKITLARLTEDLQVFVLSNVAETFSACEARGSITSDFTSGALSSLRNQVVVACPSWLSCFLDIKSDEKRPWKACATLLRACSRRNAESKATTQSNLTSIIVKIQGLAEKEQDAPKAVDKSSVGEVHNLSRSLVPNVEATKPPSTPKLPSASPAPKAADGNDSKGMTRDSKNKITASPVVIDRNRNTRVGPQQQQQQQQSRQTNAPVSNGNRPITPSAPRADRQRQAQVQQQQQRISPPNRLQATGVPRTKSVEEVPPSKVVPPATNATATTSTKTNGDNGSTPSLLSRLAGGRASLPSIPSATAVSQSPLSIPAKRRAEPDPTPSKPVPPRRPSDIDLDPVGGWSIKGAASRAAGATSTKEGNAQGSGRSTSLLDRMKGDDSFGDGSDRRGKKRTRKT